MLGEIRTALGMRRRKEDCLKTLDIPAPGRRWDCLSLGEVMLRLDPGEGRIHTTRTLNVWEGGGEYNVARGLRRCFGLRSAIATALADNPVGRLIEDLILQGGVDTSLLQWKPYDGVGRSVRNGLNFTERGFGPRAGLGCSDRGNTAVSQLQPGDYEWDTIFGPSNGARWFHTGGIFVALSNTTAEVASAAMDAARRAGTPVSYDLNYRESLWKDLGGTQRAQSVNRELVRRADVLLGVGEDFLGYSANGREAEALRSVAAEYPNLRLIATTLRTAESAGHNHWGAMCLYEGEVYTVQPRPVEILDRVGGGDSFASGLIYGLLAGHGIEWALRCGVAHGALAMTTPGDNSMATLAEVERVMAGDSARITR